MCGISDVAVGLAECFRVERRRSNLPALKSCWALSMYLISKSLACSSRHCVPGSALIGPSSSNVSLQTGKDNHFHRFAIMWETGPGSSREIWHCQALSLMESAGYICKQSLSWFSFPCTVSTVAIKTPTLLLTQA
jgi:hypothetical protein